MKRRTMRLTIAFLSFAALALVFYPLAGALAQGKGGGNGQGNGNGNKPPGGEESTNNLSFPAYFYGTALQSGTIGSYSLGAPLQIGGVGVSYGCNLPETVETTTYPNIACVDVNSEGTPLAQSYEACQAKCLLEQPDGNFTIERIYWQKNALNKWQAGYSLSPELDSDGDGKLDSILPLAAEYIDWGDNLESRSWPVQVIRVETNTFSTLPEPVEGQANPRTRYDMWHVFGQGTNELWGVRATDAGTPIPYAYLDAENQPAWSFGVNVAPDARLNLAKLQAGAPTCPVNASEPHPTEFGTLTWVFDESTGKGHWAYPGTLPDATDPVPYDQDEVYGAELNIKGSYVYGYNWTLNSDPIESGVEKAGWWRLTFYTPDHSIDFGSWQDPTADNNTLAPPPDNFQPIPPVTETQAPISAEETDTGPLYVPSVDRDNDLTYIDICITGGKGSGGKKGGGGGHDRNK